MNPPQTHKDQQNPSEGYEPIWPKDLNLDPIQANAISNFITRFFQVSDNPDLTEEWLSFFHEEAMLVMGEKVAQGKEEIRTLRKGMWEKVKTRKHTVQRFFPGVFADSAPGSGQLQPNADDAAENAKNKDAAAMVEFMVYGTVIYTLRETGGEEGIDWAAHGKLIRRESKDGEDGGGEVLTNGNISPFVFGRYRVYLSPGV